MDRSPSSTRQTADVIVFDGLVSPEVLDFARREARKFLVGEAGFGPAGDENEIDILMAGLATHGKRVVRLKSGYPAATANGTTTRGMFSLAAAPGSSADRSAAGL